MPNKEDILESQEAIRDAMDSIQLWKPGAAAITDLGRFRQCVAEGVEGRQAEQLFDNFSEDFNQNASAAQKKYEGPSKLPPTKAIGYLRNAKRELDTLTSGKTQSYECSSFAYSAISELMLDDKIRQHFDILQVGTMRINQGKIGMNYAHNIALLVPKGTEVKKNGPLPEGALIIDPWARSLGHPPEETLAVPPENFIFKDCLYPLVVNYNSANEKNLEETVREFREEYPTLEQERVAAQALIQITEAPPIESPSIEQFIVAQAPPPVEEPVVEKVQEQTSNWGFMFNALNSIASVSAYAAFIVGVAIATPDVAVVAAAAAYASVSVASNFQDYKERFSNLRQEKEQSDDYENVDNFTPRNT